MHDYVNEIDRLREYNVQLECAVTNLGAELKECQEGAKFFHEIENLRARVAELERELGYEQVYLDGEQHGT